MSYLTTSGMTFANKALMVTQIFSNMVSAGWVLHDNQDPTYRVYKSGGEAGNRITEYVKITTNVSAQIQFKIYGYWNAATHAGTISAYSDSTNTLACNESTTNNLWMQSSMDMCVLVVNYGASYSHMAFGHVPNRFWPEVATISPGATSGSNVVLNVTGVQGTFVVGRAYQIMGSVGEGRFTVTPTAVNISGGAGAITVSSLGTSISAGALIGTKPSVFICHPFSATSGLITTMFADSGTGNCTDGSSHQFCLSIYQDSYTTSVMKDVPSGRLVATPIMFMRAGSLANVYNQGYYGYTNNNILLCPNTNSFATGDTFEIGQLDSGTATGAGQSATTLQDTGKAWGTNAYAGYAVVITGGTGIGQIRRIASNTSDTLTLTANQNWATNPVAGSSTYAIAQQAYRAFGGLWTSNFVLLVQEALS